MFAAFLGVGQTFDRVCNEELFSKIKLTPTFSGILYYYTRYMTGRFFQIIFDRNMFKWYPINHGSHLVTPIPFCRVHARPFRSNKCEGYSNCWRYSIVCKGSLYTNFNKITVSLNDPKKWTRQWVKLKITRPRR